MSEVDEAVEAEGGVQLRYTLSDQADILLRVLWPGIPGRTELVVIEPFDGTPEGFEMALAEVGHRVREQASAPMRPCGFPGPWAPRSEI